MIRMSKIRTAMERDKDRFRPNPLGDGYLTRSERWMEVIAYAKGRECIEANIDDEFVRQVLATSDDDALAGKWPPLVMSRLSTDEF